MSVSSQSWLHPDDLNEKYPQKIIRTMGWLIGEDKQRIILAQCIDPEDANCKHIFYILKSDIIRKTKIAT